MELEGSKAIKLLKAKKGKTMIAKILSLTTIIMLVSCGTENSGKSVAGQSDSLLSSSEGQDQEPSTESSESLLENYTFGDAMIASGLKKEIVSHEEARHVELNEYNMEVIAHDFSKRRIDVLYKNKEDQVVLEKSYNVEKDLEGRWRLRFFEGRYVDETFIDIVTQNADDQHDGGTGVAGFELGYVIYKNFNGWPLNIIAQLGIAKHTENGLQDDTYATSIGIRIEYIKRFFGVRFKFDFVEGLNYQNEIPHFERLEMVESNDGRTSKFLNLLGFGIGVNAGDLFSIKELRHCWLGGYVRHTSGGYQKLDMFNNVGGGSNYRTTYFECALSF